MKIKISLMKATRNTQFPSHCFYADDLMVYCKGKMSNLEALKDLFTRYANCSGQIINLRKFSIFYGGITPNRLHDIVNLLSFSIGSIPFTYLGAPIFKGKPKPIYFKGIADKIKLKLASWKASLLSVAGRVQLVKSAVQGMLVHTISIYSWPTSLLREIEKWIRNFIWSGDIQKRKMVTVAWKKVCSDLDEGGLGTKSLICLNEATNLKLCWDLLHSKEQWAIIIRSRTLRGAYCIHHHILSSIWNGIKQEFNTIKENTTWLLGNGEKIQFWSDSWCGEPILQILNLTHDQIQEYPQCLSSYIQNYQWSIPDNLHQTFPQLRMLVSQITIPVRQREDELIWRHNNYGTLTMKDAFEFKKQHFPKKKWAKLIWSKDFPPSKSLMVWRLMMNNFPTDENLIERGCNIPSMCSLCCKHTENSFHLFFECPYSINISCWFASILNTFIFNPWMIFGHYVKEHGIHNVKQSSLLL